jgi:hypothetical protein
MGKGATNKRKGSQAERIYAKIFREDLGFSFCKTARQSNRMLDDAGVDLDFLPFNVQIKAGYANGLNEFKTLNIISERLPELFPPFDPVHKKMNILIHSKDIGRGKRRNDLHELVFIWLDDYIKHLEPNPGDHTQMIMKVGQKRGWSFEEILGTTDKMKYSKDGQWLVVMSFETFKQLIKDKEWQ